MRILQLIHNLHVFQPNIEELIHGFEAAADSDTIFELDGYFVVDEGFEEAVGFGE